MLQKNQRVPPDFAQGDGTWNEGDGLIENLEGATTREKSPGGPSRRVPGWHGVAPHSAEGAFVGMENSAARNRRNGKKGVRNRSLLLFGVKWEH